MKDRNWLETDISAVRYNIMLARSHVKDKKVIGIVKANCYGLGKDIAKYCEDILDGFGVATAEEGEELRRTGIRKDILILGGFFMSEENIEKIVDNDLTASLSDVKEGVLIDRIARRKNVKAKVQIAVDSGMSRWGFNVSDDSVCELFGLENLKITGVFSHLAEADEKKDSLTSRQLIAFENYCKTLKRKTGFDGDTHILNSSGIFRYPNTYGNTVRLGIAMYGYSPGEYFNGLSLKPSAKWYARVIRTGRIEEGQGVSYGWAFVADRPMNTATVAVGYADGLPRILSGTAKMYYRGKAYPVIGRICMDQCVLGLYDDNIEAGDTVEIMGEGNTPESLARLCDTINYEIISGIGRRVERYYKI